MRIGNMVYKNDVLNVDPAARADARVVQKSGSSSTTQGRPYS